MRAPGCDCSTESRTWATICNAGGRRRLHVRHERWVQGTMHNAGCPRMGMNAQSRQQAVTAPRRAGPERPYAMEAAGCDCTSGSKEHTYQGARSAGNNARYRLPQGHQAATAPRRAESEWKHAMHRGRLWLHVRQPRTNWPRSAGDNAQCRLPAECECMSGSKAYLPRSEERRGGGGGGAAAKHTRSRAAMQTQTQCSHAAVTKNQTRETTRKNTAGNTDPTATN